MINPPPLVSVVVPCFNQIKYLPTTIDWVLHQDYPNLEVVVVDGGSTDGTRDFLKDLPARVRSDEADHLDALEEDGYVRRTVPRYPQAGRRLTVVCLESDPGPTVTYNEGFARITGELCTYVVGDDIPHLTMISRLAATLQQSGADFAYADMAFVDDAHRILQVRRLPDYSFEECFARWNHLGVAHLYRSEWHRRVGLFDPTYRWANDYELHLRFAQAGCRFVHVPEVLYSVRYAGADRQENQHTPERKRAGLREAARVCRAARAQRPSGT